MRARPGGREARRVDVLVVETAQDPQGPEGNRADRVRRALGSARPGRRARVTAAYPAVSRGRYEPPAHGSKDESPRRSRRSGRSPRRSSGSPPRAWVAPYCKQRLMKPDDDRRRPRNWKFGLQITRPRNFISDAGLKLSGGARTIIESRLRTRC